MKILICDDEPYIRMLLEQTLEDLEDEGVEIFIGSNGQEGLDLILQETPDLVFLDVMMPKMSGFEVCEKVKKEHGLDSVHIVLLTAKGQEADREKGYALGADNYITKPFDPDFLFDYACERLGLDL
jgi:two-component system, OmpR family, alkaline phosphatase synthesis response regulator PhoP